MKRLRVVIFCVMNFGMLYGMEKNLPNWKDMYENGVLKLRLKHAADPNGILSLAHMNLSSIDNCDELLGLFEEPAIEVSSEELMLPEECKIRALSVSNNPELTTLPDCLSKFVDLETLIISSSGIVTFQPVLLELCTLKLKNLILSRHQFNEFSKDEKFENLVMKLESVTIAHESGEPNLSEVATKIAKNLHQQTKLFDKYSSTLLQRKKK